MSKKNLVKQLNGLSRKLEEVQKNIDGLITNPVVVEYEKLKLQRSNIKGEMNDLRYDIEMDKLTRCGIHYFVGDSKGCYCMKCGCSTGRLIWNENSPERLAMQNYVYKNETMQFVQKYYVDAKLAQKIYDKIYEANPGIDFKTATKYFEIALDNMIDYPKSSYARNERAKSRAKRLGVQSSKIRNIERN